MRTSPFLCFLLLLLPALCAAQHWAEKCGGLGNERVSDVKSGPGDVLFSTGEFGPGSSVLGQPLVSQGLSDVFVLKQDAAGTPLWVAQAGGPGLDFAGRICAAPDGSVLVCGQFSGTADLFGTSVTAQGGSTDFFVAKLSGANGALLWVRTGGSPLYTDRAASVAVGADGRVVVTGEFRGTAVFDAGTFTSTIDPGTSLPGSDVFIASYSANGTAEWLKQGIAQRDDQATDVAVDASGATYAYGLYSEDISFGTPHPNTALNQLYLVKFDAGGSEQWFRRIGGAAFQQPVDMQMGDDGNLFLCGSVQGTLTFFDSPPNTVPSPQPNAYFLVRASTAGEFQSGSAIGSVNAITLAGMDQRGGTVAVYGSFVCGFTDLQAHYNASGIFIATGNEDLFIAKHSAFTTALAEAQQFGGHQLKGAGGITSLSDGELVFCGDFSELLIFPSEGDAWGDASAGCPPAQVPAPGFCGDAHYNQYAHLRSTGQRDGFIARGYVDSREPYDPFSRSGSGCDRPFLDLVVQSAPGEYSDNVVICGQGVLRWDNNIQRPPCPPCACPPDSTVSWAVTDLWSTGQDQFDTIHVWNSGWYWRTHVSSNGCYDVADSIYVTILPRPHAWISIDGGPAFDGLSISSFCDSVMLLATDLLPGETFQWYVDGVPVQDNPIQAEVSTTYTLIVSSPNGCSGSSALNYSLLDSLSLPNITGADFGFFYNGVSLDDQDTIPACGGGGCLSGALIPTWYVDGVPTVLTQPIFVTWGTVNGCGPEQTYANGSIDWDQYPDETGWYPLHVHVVFHIEGCSPDSLVFDVYDSAYIVTGFAPVIQPLEDFAICIGDTAILVLECDGCSEVEWSGPFGSFTTSQGQDTAWVWGLGQFSVVANNTDGVFCAAVDYFYVSQAAPPPLIIAPLAVCPGDTALLFTPFPSIQYEWTGPSGPLPVDNDSLYITEIGAYYVVAYTDQGCALYGGPAFLQQFATPNLTIIPDNILCPGESAALEVTGGGLETILWDPPLSGGNVTQSVNAAGTYTCTVTACGNAFPLSAIIFASTITASIPAGPFIICGGGSVLLDGPTGDYDYLWTPGNSVEEDLLASSAGSYQVLVTDTFGCSATSNIAEVVAQQFTEPAQAEGDSICAGEPLVLIASGSGTLAWYADETLTELIFLGDTLFISAQLISDTLYVTQSEDGCTGPPLMVVVAVTPLPDVVTIAGDSALCAGEELSLTASASGAQQFSWITPQGAAAGAQLHIAHVQPMDGGIYVCTASIAGCTGMPGSVGVTVQAMVTDPVIAGNTALCEGEQLTLTVSGVQSGGFAWITPGGTVAGSALVYSTVATADAAGTYTVLADGGECPDASSSTQVVVEDCGIIIPNVFTPNGDGSNDYFMVTGTASTTFDFTVFDRWGLKVFVYHGGSIAWNGRDEKNNVLSDGVYYYELHEMRSGRTIVHTGYIQLNRGK